MQEVNFCQLVVETSSIGEFMLDNVYEVSAKDWYYLIKSKASKEVNDDRVLIEKVNKKFVKSLRKFSSGKFANKEKVSFSTLDLYCVFEDGTAKTYKINTCLKTYKHDTLENVLCVDTIKDINTETGEYLSLTIYFKLDNIVRMSCYDLKSYEFNNTTEPVENNN